MGYLVSSLSSPFLCVSFSLSVSLFAHFLAFLSLTLFLCISVSLALYHGFFPSDLGPFSFYPLFFSSLFSFSFIMFTPGVPKSPKLAFVQLCRFVTIRRIGQKSKAFQEVAHGVIAQLGKIGIAIFTYIVLILRRHSNGCLAVYLGAWTHYRLFLEN